MLPGAYEEDLYACHSIVFRFGTKTLLKKDAGEKVIHMCSPFEIRAATS